MAPKINHIIFDLGGVLLNLDYNLSIRAFEKLGIRNVSKLVSHSGQNQYFDDFETGKITAHEFRSELRKLIPNSVKDEEIDKAWNTMLLDFPKERLEYLQQLSKTYTLYLLSNTNEIHMAWFKKYINQRFGNAVFFNLFKRVYLSNEMGKRKPNINIFEQVIAENNLNPKATVFIDDSLQHIEGASKTKLHRIWLEPQQETIEVLNDFLTQFNQ